MKRILLVCSLLICYFSLDSQTRLKAQSTNMWVTYYNDVWTNAPVSEIDFTAMTHIVAAFGCMYPSESSPYYTIGDWDNTYQANLVTAAHAAGVKVILSLGTASDVWDYICSDTSVGGRLDTYVSNVTTYAQSRGYDGVDVDWEFPWGGTTAVHHGTLLHRLRNTLNTWNPHGILAIAVGNQNASDYNLNALASFVDQINIMNYDLAGYWNAVSGFNTPIDKPSDCPSYDGALVSYGVSVWKNAVPAAKIGLGISFMTYRWPGVTSYCQSPHSGGTRTYYSEIVAGITWDGVNLAAGIYHWQDQAKLPYLTYNASGTSNDWFLGYEDSVSVGYKVAYAKSQSLGGVMIWSQGAYCSGLPSGHRNPLLNAVKVAVGAASEPPASPTLSSPSNGATGVSVTPTLSWNSSSGATSYGIQVSINSGFTTTVVNQSGITQTSYTANLGGNTTYYWRVNATNAAGTSSWSSSRSFTTGAPPPPPSTPNLSSPSNADTGISVTPTLSWNASTGATSYGLQVSTSSSFSTTVVNQTGIATTSYVVSDPLTNSTAYYWRVNATNAGGTSSWSTTWSFVTLSPPVGGLVAAYSFNEGTGTTVADVSGQENNGTISGATWASQGKYGNALSFNGTSNLVSVSDAPTLDLTTGMTLEAWVYPTATPTNWSTVILKEQPGDLVYVLYAGSPQNRPSAYILTSAGGQGFSGPSALSLNTWSHLAATYDGTTLRLYINGTQSASAAASGSIINSNGSLRIGGNAVWSSEYFTGRIDEVRIYNRALTQSEIQSDMNSAIGTLPPSPPSAPTLSSPANGATGVAANPTLSWNASSGATSYGLQVSTSSTFSTTTVNRTGITATSSAVSGLGNNTTYYWRVNATNAGGTSAWSSTRSFTTVVGSTNHNIALPQGWSTISSFVQPNNLILDSLLSNVKSQLEILKNGGGQVYWPAQGINAISNWDSRYGYQIYMNAADTLTVAGSAIAPETTPIPLVNGANLVAFLRYTPMQVDSALTSIASSLIIVKNNAGQVYWPSQGINTIGSMKPGQGYQVQVTSASTLTYPANNGSTPPLILTKQLESPASISDVLSPNHYISSVSYTGSTAILLVQSPELSSGDEIAVWTSRRLLVGSGVMNQDKALITIWGDNCISETTDGAEKDELLSLSVWSHAKQQEEALTFTSITDGLTGAPIGTTLRYKTDAVWVAEVTRAERIPTAVTLFQNYPNPFNPSSVIKYGLPFATRVSLEVYNILGQRVATLVNEEQQAGYYRVVFENSALGSGVYFYRLTTNNFTETKKMMIVR